MMALSQRPITKLLCLPRGCILTVLDVILKAAIGEISWQVCEALRETFAKIESEANDRGLETSALRKLSERLRNRVGGKVSLPSDEVTQAMHEIRAVFAAIDREEQESSAGAES